MVTIDYDEYRSKYLDLRSGYDRCRVVMDMSIQEFRKFLRVLEEGSFYFNHKGEESVHETSIS